MPNRKNKPHEDESMHMILFREHEYKVYKVSRSKNRITCALAVTNLAWFILLVVTFFCMKNI
jgi:hypothetical protein